MPNKMQKNAAFCSAFGQTRLVIIRTYVYNVRYEKAKGRRRMEYMPASEAAEKRGISGRRVQKLCEEKRILGVAKSSYLWRIPKEAEKPAD